MRLSTFLRGWAGVVSVAFALGCLLTGSVMADAPSARIAMLARGINISHWFRFPPSNAASAMRSYLDEASLVSLQRSGFTYVRLAVGPEEVMQGNRIDPQKLQALLDAIARIERAGLAAMVEPHPELMQNWDLTSNAGARDKLFGFWHDLAPALRRFPAAMTFPELVNEPSVKESPQWDALQAQLLAVVRRSLPTATVILTGDEWSSIDGLLKVQPVSDRNVIYSFHTYDPALFTLLGFWDPATNKTELADYLPFPANDDPVCKRAIAPIHDSHTQQVAQYWCSLHSDQGSLEHNLRRATDWGHAHGVSVAMTELGAMGMINPGSRMRYLQAMRMSADHLNLPWSIWALDDQMGFGIDAHAFRSASQLSPAVLRAFDLKLPGR
ncbi:glycoside hydrolase family 5 protein [Lichenicoccus sp.]|uniref:glycoside hydrolase family 5 protein n=1 Tax=Lichenicoccus sp. TaxID=2781899 RepID=UPI003D0C42C1